MKYIGFGLVWFGLIYCVSTIVGCVYVYFPDPTYFHSANKKYLKIAEADVKWLFKFLNLDRA